MSSKRIDPIEYARYSRELEGKMQEISHLGPEFQFAIRSAEGSGCPPGLVGDALKLASALQGKPGEGALEVYRDLEKNIAQTEKFVAAWQATGGTESKRLLAVAQRIQVALVELHAVADSAPPEVMQAIKADLRGFRGVSTVMIGVFVVIALLKYVGVLELAWYFVIPLGIFVSVICASLVLTLRSSLRD